MANDIMGKVTRVSLDKETNEPFGVSLDGIEGYFNFTDPKWRDKLFDIPEEGQTIRIKYNESGEKRYISKMKIVEDAVQQDLDKHFDRVDKEREIDYSVHGAVAKSRPLSDFNLDLFTKKDIGIYYSVAEKIAAEKIDINVVKYQHEGIINVTKYSEDIGELTRALTLQTCKDVKDIYEHLKTQEEESNKEE